MPNFEITVQGVTKLLEGLMRKGIRAERAPEFDSEECCQNFESMVRSSLDTFQQFGTPLDKHIDKIRKNQD